MAIMSIRGDVEVLRKQNKVFKIINEFFECYLKNNKELNGKLKNPSIKQGLGRFFGLDWYELEFSSNSFSPYTGVQIYLYSINEKEIGDISDDVYDYNKTCVNEGINEFPYDGSTHRLVSDNIQIDTATGNLIKKDNSFKYAQIWFCQPGKHIGILGYSENKHLNEFVEKIKDKKKKDDLKYRIEITKNYIVKYFKELQDQMLVSDKIFFPYNWEEKGEKNCEIIVKAIEELLEARVNYLNGAK